MYMLSHIFWKGFRKNIKNFILMACSGSFMIAVTFVFAAFDEMLMKSMSDEPIGTPVLYAMSISFLTTQVLLQFLLVLAAICYMRTRAAEYGTFTLMGIKKKHRRIFIAKEYFLLIFSSIGGGVLLGYIGSFAIKKFLCFLYPVRTAEITITNFPLRYSLINAVVFFGFLFMICDELIACLGVDVVLNLSVKSGKRPKQHPVMWKTGIGFLVAALLVMQTYWGRVDKFILMLLCLVGIYLLYVSLGGLVLLALRKKESRYYKKIHWLNTWYHRFYQNVNMMYMVTVLIFMLLFLFALPLLDTFPLDTSDNYPYDVVWMANKEDAEFLSDLEEEYKVDIRTIPCIRVTSADQNEHMAIAESTYEAWTEEKISLKEDEILVNYQRDLGDRNRLPVDYGAGDVRIVAGCNRAELWVYARTGDVIPTKEFDVKYREKETRNHILTGIFGNYTSEHIIVFSDTRFEELKKEAIGANLAVLMQIPNQYDEVLAKVYEYADVHSQRDFYTGANLIYAKKEMVESNKTGRLLSQNIGILNFILVMLCAIFITTIKVENDSQEMVDKYGFYFQMGMPFGIRKKGIYKECRLTILLPVIIGIVIGIVFVLRELFLRKLESVWSVKYLVGILGVCLMVGIIYGITAMIVEHRMLKKAGKKEAE